MTQAPNLQTYYAQRAATLEDIYALPKRQADLRDMHARINELLKEHKVLEVACGTGYWTERFSAAAASVHATDFNQNMLDIAQAKAYPNPQVSFALADVYALPAASKGQYSACFAGFLWSHILREQQENLLKQFALAAGRGSLLVMIDNNYIEGESTPIARTDLASNTWQLRTQEDGSRVEILKNFPSDSALRKKLAPLVRDIRIYRNEYYWLLSCVLK